LAEKHQSLFDDSLLLAHWASEYEAFKGSETAAQLVARLKNWAAKDFQKETAAESSFIDTFFKKTWGYVGSGEGPAEAGFTVYPRYPVSGAGQTGGTGEADAALGWFGRKADGIAETPQVLCEFKDVGSGLDAPQKRKGNERSPVKQCADYLRIANDPVHPSAVIRPTWGVVTDMNEFRLYARKTMPAQYQRFVIARRDDDAEVDSVALLDHSEEAAFQRFLFWKLFQSGMLLTTGGPSPLEKLLADQFVHEKAIENAFYQEYKAYRESIFKALVEANPDFHGTRGKLVRLAQRFLDRCLFILFCEDMGQTLKYPPNLLRDLLIALSQDKYYRPDDNAAWERVKTLFESMRDGSPFYDKPINRFNGGLFESYPDLENLRIPTRIFCAKGQGENPESIRRHKDTLLYFSTSYNFGTKTTTRERSIDLYTLGRIFEQSITELEFMEAEAEGRESIANLSKRKRDGVYYTPEWVTHYIVEETVGARLQDLRQEIGLSALPEITQDHIDQWRAFLKDKRRTAPTHVQDYLRLLDQYAKALDGIKVLDPACGSGAFLIQAFNRLLEERQWIAGEKERITGVRSLFDMEELMRMVLSRNIYGVDINPESVEITRLALWLRTALPDRPLTVLEDNIRCGNSLIGSDFYQEKQPDLFSESAKERINVFDWEEAFLEIFKKGGFDCVIGNPPYVKLQHFRMIQPDVAEYLLNARRNDDSILYESTQTGNFDLYLPFIERGIELLNAKGRMGFIAPNVWLVNEYGKGLRKKIKRTQALDRWIDFKSYQVFEEAITYTALQFYWGSESDRIRCFFAPDGEIGGTNWSSVHDHVPYGQLPTEDEAWNFIPQKEKLLFAKIRKHCSTLGNEQYCQHIFQGLITSADHIYHLEKLGPGRYLNGKPKEHEVEIEDELMRPLVSGQQAKRYERPNVDKHLLFPYDLSGNRPRLWTALEMEKKFPNGWAYLKSFEEELRAREDSKFNDDQWFRFGRHQNIDKQEIPKLGVAQTVPGMRVFFDENGKFYFNNVRVNGIVPTNLDDAWFLLGIVNAPVADFVFRRIAKPKAGGYYEANKQFIAPLPIPPATPEQKQQVGELAKRLQELHTTRRDKLLLIDQRLSSDQTAEDKDFKKALKPDLAAIDMRLYLGAVLSVEHSAGELRFLVGGVPVIKDVFIDEAEVDFLAAQWRHIARTTSVTEKFTAKKLVGALEKVRQTDNAALKNQVVRLDQEIRRLDQEIEAAEATMNDLVYRLYDLSDEERKMVEADRQ